VAAIAHGDLGNETEMAGDKLVRGVAIAVLAPIFGEHVFLLRLQHWEPPDFFQIPTQSAFSGDDRQRCSAGHESALHWFTPGFPAGDVRRRSPSRRHVMLRPRSPDRSCSIPK